MTRRSRGVKKLLVDDALSCRPTARSRRACRYIDALATEITLSKGLGSRHWAAAAMLQTKASPSSSASPAARCHLPERRSHLRIEPFRRR